MSNPCSRRDLTLIVSLAFLLVYALLTHSHANSWNDVSRLATVEALVHQGTWIIEDTTLGQLTGDRVFLNGHFYSDKPPVFPWLTAGVYRVLHAALGLTLQPPRCDPETSPCYCFALLCPSKPDWAYYCLTVLMVGVPGSLMLGLFYHSTKVWALPNVPALGLTALLGLGTLVFPYSVVFANHVPAALCLMVGFYAWCGLSSARGEGEQDLTQGRKDAKAQGSTRWRLCIAGLAFALGFTFDLWTGTVMAAFGLYALWRFRAQAWPFVAGACLPLALMVLLDWRMIGDVRPPQLYPGGFDYPGSPFAATTTGTGAAPRVGVYAFRMLVGDHGWLAFTPLMLWAIVAMGQVICQRAPPLWREAVVIASATLGTVLYLVFFTDNLGGVAYGPRWLVAFTPLLCFFIPATWQPLTGAEDPAKRSPDALVKRGGTYSIVGGLALLSMLSAWRGVLDPWGAALPPVHLDFATSPVARYLDDHPDLADAVIYVTPPSTPHWPLFPKPHWRKRAREFDAASGLLPAGDPQRPLVYVVPARDAVTKRALETTFPEGHWPLIGQGKALYRVPPSEKRGLAALSVSEPQLADVRFAPAPGAPVIQVLGYQISSDHVHPGGTLAVRLVWRVLDPMTQEYTAFVHLLGEVVNPATGSVLWAQDDHQPGYTTTATYPTDRWFPEEILIDQFQLVIPDDIPIGDYQLTTGFYDLETLQRLSRSDAQGDVVVLGTITVEGK